MDKDLEMFEDFYNKGNDCDICENQYLCGLYGDSLGCKCFDEGLTCNFVNESLLTSE